jgi:hypothetical protein
MWIALSLFAQPWFVIPWFALGMAAAGYIVRLNRPMPAVMKWVWPFIALFLSVIGLALYLLTVRPAASPANIEGANAEARRGTQVNDTALLGLAGNGLGIVTAMLIARSVGASFWQEFWFEYAVGFALAWLGFHLRAMDATPAAGANRSAQAFLMALVSTPPVMGGMGAVMTYLTSSVAGAQPGPLTDAFWGFAVLGLLVGYLFTLPVAWMMVTMGWKPGLNAVQSGRPVAGWATRAALAGVLVGWGIAAMALPAWLTGLRERTPIAGDAVTTPDQLAAVAATTAARAKLVRDGLCESLSMATSSLRARHRREATTALDAAQRLAEVLSKAAPWDSSRAVLEKIEETRRGLQMGSRAAALEMLDQARTLAASSKDLEIFAPSPSGLVHEGVRLLNAEGAIIGEITGKDGPRVQLALGGDRPLWGFLDVGERQTTSLPRDAFVFGPQHTVGESYAVLPAVQ